MGKNKLFESIEMFREIDDSKAHDNKLTSFFGWIRDLVKEGSINVRLEEPTQEVGGQHPLEK